ncbi:uncharacterized protein LOC124802885 isoform X1 [Schistocerca piceifrons]|uniref:uncharacterized protein LOC124802885 isoform X1 n=1 Tax=Schistocerca piceifrons TaxID=274613 RepID=UPI001F5EC204|nr:uncharacterized protein LOC124802885 isoform X1 [Schistocerca piceifrons]
MVQSIRYGKLASDCSDDSVFDFPPLIQVMRLNVEGGPVYRGGLSGRAAAAYYREKEVIIAIKNKYGNRYGRRIQSYKPDTEAWRPERYQRCIVTLNSRTPEVIPGGLQNKKPLIHIDHDRLGQAAVRVNQQEGFSQGNHIHDNYSSGTIRGERDPVTAHRTSPTVDLTELGKPPQQRRGMMRGKRVVDISAFYCADEKEELTVKCNINQEKRELESCLRKDQGNIRNCESNQSPSELIISDEKELAVNGSIDQEKKDPQSAMQNDQRNTRNCESDQFPSELMTDEKEQTVYGIINPENSEPGRNIQKDQGNMRNCESDQTPSELIKSVESLSFS